MKKFKKLRTFMASFLVLTMVAGLVPEYALAVSGNQVAADQTYSGSGRVESDDEWDSYTVQINLTVKEGKISGLTVANEDAISDTGNLSYVNRALNGTKKATGIAEQVTGLEASMDALDAAQIDAVSGATCSSEGLKAAIKDALKQAPEAEKSTEETSKEETTAAPETKETEASTEAPTKETEASTEAPTKETEKETEEEKPAVVYAVMNVPYADFYEAEIKNDTSVDAVSSATTTKSVKFANTYFTQSEAGVTIKGIKTPVSMSEETYESIKNLVTEEDADYYISETQKTEPAAYKELTYTDGTYHFSATKGAYSTSSDANAKLTEDSTWGDFQLAMSDSLDAADVYGVYVTTTDGTSYGMRHEENIWAPSSYHELAWSTGIKTKEPHGNTLNGAHYASMMGKTLESVTWICTDGVHKVTLGTSQYVAVKLATTVTVEDAMIPSGKTAVTFSEALPEDYAAQYRVEGLEMSVKDGVMTYENAVPGSYTLVVSDANGKYGKLSTSFELKTDEMPASYDDVSISLVKAEDATADALAAYLKNISKVTVNDTAYAATGRGSVAIIGKDGAINLDASSRQGKVFDGDGTYKVAVTAAGYPELNFDLEVKTQYVTMNVPYADFYAAEIKNDTSVDAVSSATTTKSVKFANTYYEQSESGVTIKGVTVPVAINASTYEGIKDQVTEASANYYISGVLEAAPAVYKRVNYSADGAYSFSAVSGEVKESTDENASLTTSTVWGDYQLELSEELEPANVYGVYVTTEDGTGYGMRHEENIWSPGSYHELAWSSGIRTTEPHGNTLSYEHYASIMGKTITSVTWICADGVHKVTLGTPQYAAVKLAATVSVEDAKTPSGTTAVTFSEALPEDYAAEYSVEGLEMSVKDGVMTYEKAKAGTYTLMVTDANGKYAGLSASFTLSTEEMPAAFDSTKKALVPAEGYTAEDLASYLSNIISVTVGDTEYAATGRRSVKIVNEDGSINLEAASGDTAIFESCKQYAMVVKAAGYPELSFTLDTHSYDEGTVTREATCTEDGTMTYTCTICGATYEEVIAATGHDYEAVVTKPTATEKGYTTYTCKHCGDRYVSDYTDPVGEDPTEPVDPEDPAEPVNPSNPAKPTNPADSGKPADSKKSTAGKVHTGDSNAAALWLALLAMSGAAAVATRKKRRDEI